MVADTENPTLGTVPTGTTAPAASSEVVVEAFNETEVTTMIDEFEVLGDDVYSSLDSMDSLVADNVQVASGAVAGKVGQELFTQWSENCVPLLNYTRFFDGISESMRRIYNRSTETADAIDNIYNTSDPNALPNLTGTETGTTEVPITSTGETTAVPEEGTQVGDANAEAVVPGAAVSTNDGEQVGTQTSTEATNTETSENTGSTSEGNVETTEQLEIEEDTAVDPTSNVGEVATSDPVGVEETVETVTTDVSDPTGTVEPTTNTGSTTSEGGETV